MSLDDRGRVGSGLVRLIYLWPLVCGLCRPLTRSVVGQDSQLRGREPSHHSWKEKHMRIRAITAMTALATLVAVGAGFRTVSW